MADPLIGDSVAFREFTEAIAMIASVDTAVLLLGETGTGKEVIHRSVSSARTLAQVEREHIAATLQATNWVLGGWDGAAARLGLSRTTLISRMQRLGISAASKSPSRPALSRIAKRTPGQSDVVGSSTLDH